MGVERMVKLEPAVVLGSCICPGEEEGIVSKLQGMWKIQSIKSGRSEIEFVVVQDNWIIRPSGRKEHLEIRRCSNGNHTLNTSGLELISTNGNWTNLRMKSRRRGNVGSGKR